MACRHCAVADPGVAPESMMHPARVGVVVWQTARRRVGRDAAGEALLPELRCSSLRSMTTRSIRSRRAMGHRLWRFALPFVFLLALGAVLAQQVHPLLPLERSTPRAALSSFLQSGDAMGEFLAREYLASPSQEGYGVIVSRTGVILQGLDLSQLPPAARVKSGRAAALYLYEVLSRIPLPPVQEIPDSLPADARPPAKSRNVG